MWRGALLKKIPSSALYRNVSFSRARCYRSGSGSLSSEEDDRVDAPEAWDGIDPFEEWQADDHFLSKENYPGLVKLRERRLTRRPGELYAQIDLAEAYVLNGEYHKALAWLSELHRKAPDYLDIQHLILDALFVTGKTEDDFPWVEKPDVGAALFRQAVKQP
jgi:hypothetical protein